MLVTQLRRAAAKHAQATPVATSAERMPDVVAIVDVVRIDTSCVCTDARTCLRTTPFGSVRCGNDPHSSQRASPSRSVFAVCSFGLQDKVVSSSLSQPTFF